MAKQTRRDSLEELFTEGSPSYSIRHYDPYASSPRMTGEEKQLLVVGKILDEHHTIIKKLIRYIGELESEIESLKK